MDKVIISKGYNSLTGESSSELDTPPVSQIIDGVDVSGCKYWNGSKLGYCNIGLWANDGTHICECEYNCYYKQLQRLKEENERLKTNKDRCAFKSLDNTFCHEADKKITELELSRDSYKVSYETAKKYREKAEKALQKIRNKLDFNKQELEECLHNPIDDEIREIINSVIGAEE